MSNQRKLPAQLFHDPCYRVKRCNPDGTVNAAWMLLHNNGRKRPGKCKYKAFDQKLAADLVNTPTMNSKPEFDFDPLFFLLDTNRIEMKSIAVSKCTPEGYEGVYFKEWNNGWSSGPIWVGKGCISNGQYDFTENLETAIEHAGITLPINTQP